MIRRLWALLLLAIAVGTQPASADTASKTLDWPRTVAAARGQTVYFNAWGGSERINDYVAWVGERVAADYGITLKQVKLADTADAVARVLAEKTAGKSSGGSVDLIWINGENFAAMKAQALLFGPFAETLPNYRLVDIKGKPTTRIDFTVPTDGLEAPWGMAQIVFLYDTDRVAQPPRDMAQFLAWATAHPGRFTYPAPPDFTGSTFLKQALYGLVADRGALQQPAGDDNFAAVTAPLWQWLDRLHPQLWRGGRTFPQNDQAQRQLLDDGEIDISLSFNPGEASSAIAQGLLPATVRTYVLDGGTIGNTHFVAIPFNASAKEAAMVVADFLLSPEAQLRKQDPSVWGDPTVLAMDKLDAADRGKFAALPLGVRDPVAGRAGAGPARAAPVLDDAPGGGVASPLRQVSIAGALAARGRPRPDLLKAVPALTLAAFLAPVAAGLLGTLLPAFGFLPALGGTRIGLDPWYRLLSAPELPAALRLTLTSGLLAGIASVAIVVAFCAAAHGTRLFRALERLLAPLLAIPHAAVAIGLAFLLAPSGWLVRLLSPWATGWAMPPDLATVQDPLGLALTVGLVVKEAPYLLLMTLAASSQVEVKESLAIARSLGYGPLTGWLKAVLPRIYPQIRLPIYAVIAYGLSVVDMALLLAPATPPPLAPLLLRWFNDPDLALRFCAAAGAILQLLIVVAAIAAWRGTEAIVARLARVWIAGGRRGGSGRAIRVVASGLMLLLVALAVAALATNALWSVAERWRYPAVLPTEWTLLRWRHHADALGALVWTTAALGATAALCALGLTLGCLENEQRHGLHVSNRGLWLIYAPLLVPQMSFLFGLQVLLVTLGLDGSWIGLVWSHLLFVLPYVFLALADPFRRLDERYARSARCLGASPNRVFWRIKLPMLRRPILAAFAVGFAVSAAQYLPTLFAGAGRFATLTTEAVGLAAGADRRVIGLYALVQAILPLLPFLLAVPTFGWRRLDRRSRVPS